MADIENSSIGLFLDTHVRARGAFGLRRKCSPAAFGSAGRRAGTVSHGASCRRVFPSITRIAGRIEGESAPAWLATLVIVAALGLGVIWLQTGLLGRDAWPIEWLDVEGEIRRTSAEQIRAAVVVHADQGFFAVDLAAVRRAVEELPWTESGEVRRRWPDTLVISVREHRPVARWNETDLLNHRGERFAVPGAAELQGLPWLEGPEARLEDVLDTWTQMHHELSTINTGIERVTLDDRGAWEVRLSNDIILRLGREDPVGRVQRYVKVADELRGLREFAPELVDLRHTNGLAVRWPTGNEGAAEDHG